MSFDKEDRESNQSYMKRKLPMVFKTLTKISGLGEACIELFDQKKFLFYEDPEDLFNKLLIGLLKQELDDHIRNHEEVEEKIRTIKESEMEWTFIGYEKDTIVLMNALHQHAKIPSFLFKAIKVKKKIDCIIEDEGEYFHYKYKKESLGKIPKSLQLQIVRNNVKGLPQELDELKR